MPSPSLNLGDRFLIILYAEILSGPVAFSRLRRLGSPTVLDVQYSTDLRN